MKTFLNAEVVDVNNTIDWNSVVTRLKNLNVPSWKPFIDETDWKKQLQEMKSKGDNSDDGAQGDGYRKFFEEWSDANVNFDSIRLYNYFSGDHYSYDEVEKIFCKTLNITHHRSWFSRLDPGYLVPWHTDVEPVPLEGKTLERYCVFINGPKVGHAFMLGKDDSMSDCFSSMQDGTIIKWHNNEEWHLGSNFGFESKWMYHFVGFREG